MLTLMNLRDEFWPNVHFMVVKCLSLELEIRIMFVDY